MLGFNKITRDTIGATQKKERVGNLLNSLPFHAGTDPLLLQRAFLPEEIGSGCLRHVSWILLSCLGSRF